ncbi:MAG: RNA-binding domain-containing protein [Nitrosopumilaceae archaeon]|nr:RNA-binding domain-containing protein [Nitrosopumilaceae archaeon]
MNERLQITVSTIIHATEDDTKIIESFEEFFGLNQKQIMLQKLTGHFDNPIIMVTIKLTKKTAREFLNRLNKLLSKSQIEEISEGIEDRIENSTLHIRLSKQDFIKRKIEFREKDSIKIKISTPVYNKKDRVEIFSNLFLSHLN